MTDRALYGAMFNLFDGTEKVCFPSRVHRVYREGGIKFNWRELTREGEACDGREREGRAAKDMLKKLISGIDEHPGGVDLPEIKKYTGRDKQKHGEFYLFLSRPQQCIALADLIIMQAKMSVASVPASVAIVPAVVGNVSDDEF
jgi:hypothetical protein